VVWGQVRTQVPALRGIGGGERKEMAASDLVLTRSVELGYVQANSCVYIGCAAVS
jgi:hypothetical protein